jgi:hypothetical protein
MARDIDLSTIFLRKFKVGGILTGAPGQCDKQKLGMVFH